MRKRIFILMVVVITLAIYLPRQFKITASTHAVAASRQELLRCTNLLVEIERELKAEKEQLHQEKVIRDAHLASLSEARHEMTAKFPEAQWVAPPASLPDWNSESPYVWVRKEVMGEIDQQPFARDGSLLTEAASVLAIPPIELCRVNEQLRRILQQYRDLELAAVERVDEQLPGNRDNRPAITIRIKPPKQEGARLFAQFETALREGVGEQRTRLLLAVDHGSMERTFGQLLNETDACTISMSRNSQGGYDITKHDGGWLSTSIPKDHLELMDSYVPPHLQRFFMELVAAKPK